MLCKVDGCTTEVRYKAACLCQKHYFRLRRKGHMNLHTAKPRIEDERGYQFLHAARTE